MLPSELLQARKTKRAGLMVSTGLVTAGAAYVMLRDPALSAGVLQASIEGLALLAAALAIAKLALQDRLAIELYSGGLAIEVVPSLRGPTLPEGAVEVRRISGNQHGSQVDDALFCAALKCTLSSQASS